MNDTIEAFFIDEGRGLEVCIADNGFVAYAILRPLDNESKTLAGVWLYNHPGVTAEAVAGKLPDRLPVNQQEYVVDAPFDRIQSETDVDVYFGGGPELEDYADIWIGSKLHAHLEPRAPIGWCVLAKKSGPLAKRMEVVYEPDGTADVHLCDYEDDGDETGSGSGAQ